MLVSRPDSAVIRALLPGRTRWFAICHAEPAGCRHCLGAVARFLAEELAFDLAAAIDRSTEAYQAEFTGRPCTADQARELRRLTIEACWPGLVVDRGAIVADLDSSRDTAEAAAR